MSSAVESVAARSALADYLELSKPEVTSLILVAAAVGYAVGAPRPLDPLGLFHAIFGTLLVAAGTGALNQFFERDLDSLMRRTGRRPLPAGRLAPARALAFGLGAAISGIAYLAAFANLLAASLAAATCASYLLLYTPLKRRSTICTTVGAFPGAAPPLIGWAAATGELSAGAWFLFAILFFWQFPHFLAIAWLYREDYGRAGIFMLPVVEPDGISTSRQTVFCTLALFPACAALTLAGMAGWIYFGGALLLNAGFLYCGLRLSRQRTLLEARRLLHASVIYLPLLYGLLLIDRGR